MDGHVGLILQNSLHGNRLSAIHANEVWASTVAAMPDVRQLIVKTLKEKGISLNDASLRIGRNPTYLQQYVKYGRPDRLPEDVRDSLAPILEVSADDLRENNGSATTAGFVKTSSRTGPI